MSISDRLREEREKLRLSQTAIAEIGGVQKRAQINYESGERLPDAGYLAAIAAAGADVCYILTGQRSQAAAEIDLLPSDERVLVEAYRHCNADAKCNLIQTAALLSAGMPPSAPLSKAPAQQSASVNNNGVHVGGNVAAGAVIVRRNFKGGIKRGPDNI